MNSYVPLFCSYGDYPKLPDRSQHERDPWYEWDHTDLRRNWGEPVRYKLAIWLQLLRHSCDFMFDVNIYLWDWRHHTWKKKVSLANVKHFGDILWTHISSISKSIKSVLHLDLMAYCTSPNYLLSFFLFFLSLRADSELQFVIKYQSMLFKKKNLLSYPLCLFEDFYGRQWFQKLNYTGFSPSKIGLDHECCCLFCRCTGILTCTSGIVWILLPPRCPGPQCANNCLVLLGSCCSCST